MKAKTCLRTAHESLSWIAACISLLILLAGCAASKTERSTTSRLEKALMFHASFDHGANADYGAGDRTLYTQGANKTKRAGLPASGVVSVTKGRGRFGDALQFHKKGDEMILFQAGKNLDYRTNGWSGTVSFWLRVDPAKELAPGYCDPVQITPREWNDAAFFVEFEKRTNSIPFRLGAYSDFKVWNPQNREWKAIPAEEKPLVTVPEPPFSGDRWTHVVFTFENFNTAKPNGVAKLYLNGDLHGVISPRLQTFTWDPDKTQIKLGLSYIGLFDDLAIFNRALAGDEIQRLYQLARGVGSLIK